MESLPPELWNLVFRSLSRQEWLALSRVCGVSRAIAQAALYEDVSLTFHTATVVDAESNRVFKLFSRSLVERPALASLVHRLTLHSIEPSSHLPHPQAVLDVLARCRNLQLLILRGVYIDCDIMSTLGLLPVLKSLQLRECEIDPTLPYGSLHQGLPHTLLRLHIVKPHCTDGWLSAIPAMIQSLDIAAPSLCSGRIIQDLIGRDRNHSLATLKFHISVPDNLITFLMSCPQLRNLSLPVILRPDSCDLLRSLPAHAIPLLENYSGGFACMESLIRDRPIHTISVFHRSATRAEVPIEILQPLCRTSVPVQRLTVGVYAITSEMLQHAPPKLRYLEVNDTFLYGGFGWVSVLTTMPELYSVKATVAPVPFLDQEAIVGSASVACSSLQEFVFVFHSLNMTERVVWRRQKESQWELFWEY